MYFEIVKKNTVVEGTHWHARIRTDEQHVLFRSNNYSSRQLALQVAELVKAQAADAPIYEVSE